jgi:hypothetical protein
MTWQEYQPEIPRIMLILWDYLPLIFVIFVVLIGMKLTWKVFLKVV